MNPNTINWYEIPTTDLDRATRFYEAVLGTTLKREVFFETPMSIFTLPGGGQAESGVGGCLIKSPELKPGSGTLIYLDARGDLDGALARAATAGGRVVLPKTSIGEMGQIAVILDTEGNRVGLHSQAA